MARASHRPLLIAAALLGIVATLSCGRTPASSGARHVVLISIDTCRADHLGCYGGRRAATPHIDEVAAQATLFRNTLSPVPLTLPAHCSMLTGTTPPRHGVHDNIDGRLSSDSLTLAEILRANGFATAAVISSFVLDRRYGLDQGFDEYLDELGGAGVMMSVPERRGDDASRLAVDWLARSRDRDGFLFLHYYDPHAVWAPPEPWATEYADEPYAGEIAYVDSCIGTVLDSLRALGIYDSSLIIITADHGEMLGEHGEIEHSYFVYQGALRVPLIVKLPYSRRGATVDGRASLVDLVPTVCSALDIPRPPQTVGVDLLRHDSAGAARPLYFESLTPTGYGAASLLGLVRGPFKLIHTRRPELYDLEIDPEERHDLAADRPDIVGELQGALHEVLSGAKAASSSPVSGQDIARLAALGYVGARVDEASLDLDAQRDLEDPKDLLWFHLEAQEASRLLGAKRLDEAAGLLERLVEQRPDYTWGYRQLGAIALEREDPSTAIADFEKALALEPGLVVLRADLARLLLSQGRTDEAVRHLRRAVGDRPDDGMLHRDLGVALAIQGRHEEAIASYRRARDAGITSAELCRQLGWSLEMGGQVDAAVDEYRRSVELDPANPEGYVRLGSALTALDRVPDAIDAYRRGLVLRPDSVELLNNLAWKLATSAEPSLRDGERAVELAERANRRSGGGQPVVLDTLAAAYATAGRFDRAVEAALRARQAAVAAGSEELADQIGSRLELYRRHTAFVAAG